MKKNYQIFMEKNYIREIAEFKHYHVTFLKDMHTYVKMLLNSEFGQQFSYTNLQQKKIDFAYLGFIGKLGVTNKHMEAFPTCTRYACLANALEELPVAKQILNEVEERMHKSSNIMKNLEGEKLKKAHTLYQQLFEILQVVQCGIFLVQEMDKNKSGFLDAFDKKYKNIYAEKWLEVYPAFEKENKWGF